MISGEVIAEVSPIISKIVNIAFLIMVSLGMFFLVTSLYVILYNDKFLKADTLKKVFKFTFILPYIAIFSGWIVSEMGRQPYVVYGLLLTSEGVSQNVSVASVWFSLLTTTALYILVLFFVIHFLIIQIRQSIDHNKYYLAYKGEDDNES
jgi:cytochrome d ubiquinol oxidase subunit I